MIKWKRIIYSASLLLTASLGAMAIYILQPPNHGRLEETSQVIRSENGSIINLRLTQNGFWREAPSLEDVDPNLINVLIAYEDKRFWTHHGVDPLAVLRASIEYVRNGKISSGASTLTMQTVRLIDPSLAKRTIVTKIRQMAEAIRLDAHWSKNEILEAYFTLAPYGGNIEGINAATEAWFQKTPKDLRLNEIAMLVALPQSPERRRPDRFPDAAFEAKKVVLQKVQAKLKINDTELREALSEQLPARLAKPRSYAPHLADRRTGSKNSHTNTSINAEWQKQVQSIIETEIQKFPAPIQAAALVVERKTGQIKAYVGSSGYGSKERKGGNNFLTATRSPGSTLKPLVYGKALQRSLIEFDEVFNDSSFYRSGYNPTNFDNTYSGKVTLKDALLRSLNIPALVALEKLGPRIFETELKTVLGLTSSQELDAGLSLAVGGFYLNAEQLTNIYLMAIDPGFARNISFDSTFKRRVKTTDPGFLTEEAAKQILHLLIQDLPNGDQVAFKTGTSFARHDAWSVQIFKDHLVVAWVGTPDNQPTEVLTGRDAAFPITNGIGLALAMKAPERPKLQIRNKLFRTVKHEGCATLINYPENGTWIRSDNTIIGVIGSEEAEWYLNARKLGSFQKQIKLLRPGIQKLTAKSANCSQTAEFFVEF